MSTSPLKRALLAGLVGFLVVFLLALFAFDYGLRRSLLSSLPPVVGVVIGVYLANRFFLRNR